jgi:hypothetical protein
MCDQTRRSRTDEDGNAALRQAHSSTGTKCAGMWIDEERERGFGCLIDSVVQAIAEPEH